MIRRWFVYYRQVRRQLLLIMMDPPLVCFPLFKMELYSAGNYQNQVFWYHGDPAAASPPTLLASNNSKLDVLWSKQILLHISFPTRYRACLCGHWNWTMLKITKIMYFGSVVIGFFFLNLGSSILPKNAPPLDTRVSESPSHIQTHLILNITIAWCFPHPAVHLHPQSQPRAGGMAHDHNAYHRASRLPLPTLSF